MRNPVDTVLAAVAAQLQICLLLVAVLPACGGTDEWIASADAGQLTGSDPEVAEEIATFSLPATGVVVRTSSGWIQGGSNGRSRYFLGIPYAAPPTGDLRWQAPLVPARWSGVRPATSFGNYCPQVTASALQPPTDLVASEDCLTVNVWTPWPVPVRAPVMLFIHGGGFIQGSASSPTYDGAALAEGGGVVVASINYRLGVLGFLAHAALGGESGLFGLQDQQAAMRWVQRNIASFGGDPNNVTIFGESAGGFSVCMHLVMPGSQGLFQRAIGESGPCESSLPTLAVAYQQGMELATAVGCSSDVTSDPAACLRRVPAEQLIAALPTRTAMLYGEGVMWKPPVNGTTMPDQPLRLLEQGRFQPVPVLFGTNQDEGSLFAVAPLLADGELTESDLLSDEQYRQLVLEIFGDQLYPTIYARYQPANYATGSRLNPATRALSDLLGDWTFNCPTRRTVRAISRALAGAGSTSQAFLYRFTWKPTLGALAVLGSHHGAELPFVFGHLTDAMPMIAYQPADTVLSEAAISLWTSFARTGNPNSALLLTTPWPAYQSASDQHLILDRQLVAGAHLEQAQCDFWDNLGIYDTP